MAQSTYSNGAPLEFQRWDQAIQHASKEVELALKIDSQEVVKYQDNKKIYYVSQS